MQSLFEDKPRQLRSSSNILGRASIISMLPKANRKICARTPNERILPARGTVGLRQHRYNGGSPQDVRFLKSFGTLFDFPGHLKFHSANPRTCTAHKSSTVTELPSFYVPCKFVDSLNEISDVQGSRTRSRTISGSGGSHSSSVEG
jgi:hypothetical protein